MVYVVWRRVTITILPRSHFELYKILFYVEMESIVERLQAYEYLEYGCTV